MKLLVALTLAMIVAVNGNANDDLFIDAGSSGSKCFGCHTCDKESASKSSEAARTGAPTPAAYRDELAVNLQKSRNGKGKGCISTAKNAGNVPMLATAGLRLVSQAKNTAFWTGICQKQGKNAKGKAVTFAKQTKGYKNRCGTIPGTIESYFEWVSGDGRGGITCGGASAQISIPFTDAKKAKAFKAMVAAITKDVDCKALDMSGIYGNAPGSTAPIFNADAAGLAPTKTNCIKDYVTFVEPGDAKLGHHKAKVTEGLGLISFLSLRGAGGFLAGGADEVEEWAIANCKGKNFGPCKDAFDTALGNDPVFKHVKAFFAANHAGPVANFVLGSGNSKSARYGTSRAPFFGDPKNTLNGHKGGHSLLARITKVCKGMGATAHQPNKYNTCTRALWAAYLTTQFFPAGIPAEAGLEPKDGGKIVVLLEKAEATAMASVAAVLGHEVATALGAETARKLTTEMEWTDKTWADGARTVFNAEDSVEQREKRMLRAN